MPAPAAEVFEAFHHHEKRLEWDTLLSATALDSGGVYPSVGAISSNTGRN